MNLEKLGPWATAAYAIVDRYGTKFAMALVVSVSIGYGVYDKIVEPYLGVPALVAALGLYCWFDSKTRPKGNKDATKTPTA